MKKIILFFLSFFITFRNNITVVFLLIIPSIAIAQKSDSLLVTTLKKDTIDIKQKHLGDFIVVFSNTNSCTACKESIKKLLDTCLNYEIISLIRCNNSMLSRRLYKIELEQKFTPSVIYFDIHQKEDDPIYKTINEGDFGNYNVTQTPAILINKGSVITFVSYRELFNGVEINPEIIQILK